MVVAVRLTSELERRLEELARRTGRSKSFYVREAIEEHLDELEERYWADEVVARWQASDKTTRPIGVLKAELEK